MKPISWGTGIVIVIVIFFIVVLGTVAFTTTIDVNLVTENYYEKELKHQNLIDKIKRTNNLPAQVSVKVLQDNVYLKFPSIFHDSRISGEIEFYRPSDHKKDFSLPIDLNDSLLQIISTGNISRGVWKIKIDWEVNSTTYYNEQIVMIN